MTEIQYALGKLAEECTEAAKECLKAQQYGFDSYHPDEPGVTNRERLLKELHDIEGAVRFLNHIARGTFEFIPCSNLAMDKMDRISEQMDISVAKGQVVRDDDEEEDEDE